MISNQLRRMPVPQFQVFQPGPGAEAYPLPLQGTPNVAPERELAERFANATWRMTGIDVSQAQHVLKSVHDQNLYPTFNQTVTRLAWEDGRQLNGVVPVLQQKLAGNALSRFFNRAPLLETMDYLVYGKNTYRPRPTDYRLRGMWTSIADFLSVCQKHPVMSSTVIGAVAYYGGKYPFLGGVSGVMILAWSAAAIALNELKARTIPRMNAEKATHYQVSGENAMAFLLTASGVDGIYKGVVNGMGVMRTAPVVTERLGPALALVSRLWQATRSQLAHGEEAGLRFVLGLFDNVLLPFNALADRLSGAPPQAAEK